MAPFLDRIASRLQAAHLVIGRAGGSSVAELAVVGRPSILVPLPIAASDEQSANALALVEAGGGWMLRQNQLSPDTLGALLAPLLADPSRLQNAAEAAATLGRRDAATTLADLVEKQLTISGDSRLRSAPATAIPGAASREMPA